MAGVSGFLALTDREFMIKDGRLVTRIPGLSLVMFYSKTCGACEQFLPIFRSLPGRIHGVQFGSANVAHNGGKIASMIAQTLPQGQQVYVPYVVCYMNGEPYIEYRGPRTVESIIKFLHEVTEKVSNQKNFTAGKVCKGGLSNLPGYCTDDMIDDEVCYMSYDEAYNGKPVTKSTTGYTYEEAYSK
jgi:hypothetical protein